MEQSNLFYFSRRRCILSVFLNWPKKRHQQQKTLMFFWHKTFILKDVHESIWHFCQMQFKCLRKLWSDEMLTGLMSVSLFYRYFCNLWNKKSLTSEKRTILSCQMLYSVHSAHSSIDIYIYAFSRRFYPKRLTVLSGYTFFVSMCSLGIEPTTFALLTQCSNHWATGIHVAQWL